MDSQLGSNYSSKHLMEKPFKLKHLLFVIEQNGLR